MPKVIESPVKRFAGQVVLPDYLTFPQYRAFADASDAAMGPNVSHRNQALLPGILAVVQEWRLERITPEMLTPESFPSTPFGAVDKLLGWLEHEITELIFEADESPNA